MLRSSFSLPVPSKGGLEAALEISRKCGKAGRLWGMCPASCLWLRAACLYQLGCSDVKVDAGAQQG